MSIVKAGFRRIAIWDPENTKANLIDSQLRRDAELMIEESDSVKDDYGRVYPSRINFSCKYRDYGYGRPLLYFLNELCKGFAVSAEVIASRLSNTPTYNGVFKFLDPDLMGLQWDLRVTDQENYAEISLANSLEWERGKLVIDNAQNNTIETWSGSTERAFPHTYYRKPGFLSAKYGSTNLFERSEIVSRNISFKTTGTPNADGQQLTDWINVEASFTLRKNSKQDIKALLEIGPAAAFEFKDALNTAGNYQQISFASGVLTPRNSFKLTETERTVTIALTGGFNPVMLSYSNTGSNEVYTINL